MLREYEITIVPCRGIHGLAYCLNGRRIIRVPEVRGYVTFALFCHEVAHHLLNHVDDASRCKDPVWRRETSAWGFARSVFSQNDLYWAPSVQAFVRACLARMINEDLPDEERRGMSREMKALKILGDAGL